MTPLTRDVGTRALWPTALCSRAYKPATSLADVSYNTVPLYFTTLTTTSTPCIAPEVRFQHPQYNATEGNGDETVIIVMNGVSTVDIILNIRTIPGTATGMISISALLTSSSCHMSCSTNGL